VENWDVNHPSCGDEVSNCGGYIVTIEEEVFNQFSAARMGLQWNRLVKITANYQTRIGVSLIKTLEYIYIYLYIYNYIYI
jgi:hypothetical protein